MGRGGKVWVGLFGGWLRMWVRDVPMFQVPELTQVAA